MSEVLIHLIIPAAALIVAGFDRRLVLIFCPLAIIPDFDILLGIHRQSFHSIFVLGAISLLLLIYTFRYKPQWKTHAIIISILLISHPLLDLITGPIQILWPIDYQFHLKFVAPTLDPTTLAIYFTEFPIQLLIYGPGAAIPGYGTPFPLFENTGLIAFMLMGIAVLFWGITSRKSKNKKKSSTILPSEDKS